MRERPSVPATPSPRGDLSAGRRLYHGHLGEVSAAPSAATRLCHCGIQDGRGGVGLPLVPMVGSVSQPREQLRINGACDGRGGSCAYAGGAVCALSGAKLGSCIALTLLRHGCLYARGDGCGIWL